MAGDFSRVEGLEDLKRKFKAVPTALRRSLLRNWLAAGGRLVRDEAKRRAPVLAPGSKNKYRKPGTVRKAIVVRTSKAAKKTGDVGVFVNVRPLKSAQIRAFKASGGGSGYKNPDDPFYWRWLEFGRAGRAGQGIRARVGRIKIGGRVLVKGQRFRRALRAVGAMGAYGFLQAGAKRLPDALKAFEKKASVWFAKTDATGKVSEQ